ncbi:adenosine deaminase AGSA-like [Saccostrea echinata]|uniref:adenosine deaminase AGSA-like n=1 Tax=Saccostrea echinata TaxID=191078 RepID=UPI002A80DE1D|nr:adenosine deaminase AGSA-like [Saccostrea echinata]
MDTRISCVLILFSYGCCSHLYLTDEYEFKTVFRGVRDRNGYIKARNEVILAESNMRIGRDVVLDKTEQRVNDILMKYKELEINKSRTLNGAPFPPSIDFLVSKPMVEKSQVFQIIKLMPKGAALHLHDCSMVDLNWLVKNATYRENCYMCVNVNYTVYFKFFGGTPPSNPGCPWKSVKTERAKARNVDEFDRMLYMNMSLITPDPRKAYPTIDVVWDRFSQTLDQANGLINYAPVFADYFYEALNEFNLDNVQYLEFRGLFPEVYELDGSTKDRNWVVKTYNDLFEKFTADHKHEFSGGKMIYSGIRVVPEIDILNQVKEAIHYRQLYPDHFAGYDLVGQEDPGVPLVKYLDALLYPSEQTPPVDLPYFFHAGETDWEGTPTDNNLIDAVLLNTSRIGHGYAIVKHPQVMKMVKERNIAVEVNPISNQVLLLLSDLRNHPAAELVAQDFPVVISADDPAVWGAQGLSYDFYMAFMALSGETTDLRLLKKLAINSIQYSAMTPIEKSKALNLWRQKWDAFIQRMLHQVNQSGSFPLNPFG